MYNPKENEVLSTYKNTIIYDSVFTSYFLAREKGGNGVEILT